MRPQWEQFTLVPSQRQPWGGFLSSPILEKEEKSGECYCIITPIAETGKTFSDQTGHFPITSSKGNKYIMIMYDYDSNNILGEVIKSRTGDELLRAFKVMHGELKQCGSQPKMHRLDNECPVNP